MNAGILAAKMLAMYDDVLEAKVAEFMTDQRDAVHIKAKPSRRWDGYHPHLVKEKPGQPKKDARGRVSARGAPTKHNICTPTSTRRPLKHASLRAGNASPLRLPVLPSTSPPLCALACTKNLETIYENGIELNGPLDFYQSCRQRVRAAVSAPNQRKDVVQAHVVRALSKCGDKTSATICAIRRGLRSSDRRSRSVHRWERFCPCECKNVRQCVRRRCSSGGRSVVLLAVPDCFYDEVRGARREKRPTVQKSYLLRIRNGIQRDSNRGRSVPEQSGMGEDANLLHVDFDVSSFVADEDDPSTSFAFLPRRHLRDARRIDRKRSRWCLEAQRCTRCPFRRPTGVSMHSYA